MVLLGLVDNVWRFQYENASSSCRGDNNQSNLASPMGHQACDYPDDGFDAVQPCQRGVTCTLIRRMQAF